MRHRDVVALCAGTTVVFADMYATQPVLPLLSRDFNVTPSQAGLTVSIVALTIALASPVLGSLSDRFGRKFIIVTSLYALAASTFVCAICPSFSSLLATRALQGIFVPGISGVGVAYIGDRVERTRIATYVGIFIAANGMGGLLGRVFSGIVAGTHGWRATFVLYGAATLVAAIALHLFLKRDDTQRESSSILAAFSEHVRNRSLVGAFAAGALIFFAFVAFFTYVPYLLDGPPFRLRVDQTALVYLAYGAGVIASIVAGTAVRRFNAVFLMRIGAVVAAAGCLITLSPSLPAVTVGAIVLCTGMFIVQGIAPGYVNRTAVHAKASANALYQTAYYAGAVFWCCVAGTRIPARRLARADRRLPLRDRSSRRGNASDGKRNRPVRARGRSRDHRHCVLLFLPRSRGASWLG